MIYGTHIRLRKAEREDLPTFVAWLNDPEVREGLAMYLPMSLAEEERDVVVAFDSYKPETATTPEFMPQESARANYLKDPTSGAPMPVYPTNFAGNEAAIIIPSRKFV